jgi:hypothetical protein
MGTLCTCMNMPGRAYEMSNLCVKGLACKLIIGRLHTDQQSDKLLIQFMFCGITRLLLCGVL